ncbi:MAG: 4a-hydroxytetrahydrobiopterin dehydratase [Lysobacterales bacterium]
MASSDLISKTCTPCEGGTLPLNDEQVAQLLPQIEGWTLTDDGCIERLFRFDNYYETMAFVNASAWLSHQQDHHPDLVVGYGQCRVSYITHAIDGLSENDFICAAKVSRLIQS